MKEFLKTYVRKALAGLMLVYTAQRRNVTIAACVLAVLALTLGVARCAHAQTPGNHYIYVKHLTHALSSAEAPLQLAVSVFVRTVSDLGQDRVHCAGVGVTSDDLTELARKVMPAADPNESAAPVMMRAMAQAYPCGSGT